MRGTAKVSTNQGRDAQGEPKLDVLLWRNGDGASVSYRYPVSKTNHRLTMQLNHVSSDAPIINGVVSSMSSNSLSHLAPCISCILVTQGTTQSWKARGSMGRSKSRELVTRRRPVLPLPVPGSRSRGCHSWCGTEPGTAPGAAAESSPGGASPPARAGSSALRGRTRQVSWSVTLTRDWDWDDGVCHVLWMSPRSIAPNSCSSGVTGHSPNSPLQTYPPCLPAFYLVASSNLGT